MFPFGEQYLVAYGKAILSMLPMVLMVMAPLALLLWFFGYREKEVKEEERALELSRKAKEAEKNQPPAQEAQAGAKKRLLIVDDSAVVRAKLRKLFEAKYEVTLAADGQQAWDLIEAGEAFAAVLTDLEMPNMDGFELIAAIQGGLATEDVPIVAITGSDELQARVRSCQGLYGIFQKPWVDRELLKRIDAITGMKAR